jgi:hypothetical protein
VTIALVAPVAFVMGWRFPIGMVLLERRSPSFIPWAWGINDFASVAAAPLALLLSRSFGCRGVPFTAIGCYALAGVLAVRFERKWAELGTQALS